MDSRALSVDVSEYNCDGAPSVNPSPTFPVLGCTDPIATNYNPSATVDDGSCTIILGCTDPAATNYNPLATRDDGSCTYILGCTDPGSTNYNSFATRDDGSCAYRGRACNNGVDDDNDGFIDGADPQCRNTGDDDESGDHEVSWTKKSTPDNMQLSQTPSPINPSPTSPVLGCTDPAATNYNPLTTINDGSCTYPQPNRSACSNGRDDDNDGFTDGDDPQCLNSGDDDESGSHEMNWTKTSAPDNMQLSQTPFPNLASEVQARLDEVAEQKGKSLKSNITYNVPRSMKLDETIVIELLLNPSKSVEELTTPLINNLGLPTSTLDPDILVSHEGGEQIIMGADISITDRMKAELKSLAPGAFTIESLSDAEQLISSSDTTRWRWSVTANEEGTRTMSLVISMLLINKIDGEDYWMEVGAYDTDIVVDVTASQRLESLNWEWIFGIVITALFIPLFFRWYDARSKSTSDTESSPNSKEKRSRKTSDSKLSRKSKR